VLSRFPAILLRCVRGTLGGLKGVRLLRARHVRIASPHGVPVQCDGEFLGETPAEVAILPAALRLLVPARGAIGHEIANRANTCG
jgi:diacylglycerol kinase family enzyme